MRDGPRRRTLSRSWRPGAAARRAGAGLAGLACGLFLAAVGGGCAGTAARVCGVTPDQFAAVTTDSLAIDPFLRLTSAEQAARRAQVATHLRLAGQQADVAARLEPLLAAAAAAPDDPDLWLDAAQAWRAVGDQYRTGSALGAAAAAVRRLDDPAAPLHARGTAYRHQAALATALAQAWHHCDRAEWNDAADWARTALQLEPASADALEVFGLAQGRLGQESRVREITDELLRLDPFAPFPVWIHAAHEEGRDRLRAALGYCLNLEPELRDALACYRDMGTIAERLGEWSLADRWYAHSAAASALAGSPCLERRELPRLEPGPDGRTSRVCPVWLSLGCYYVTGSLSAYTRHAFERFEALPAGPARDRWAGLAVNAAGILLRREPGHPWALRVRGLVFAATGKGDLARDDLRRAAAALEAAYLPGDARIEAELGHQLLAAGETAGAVPRLRQAVALDPAAAAAWADLGMGLATLGDQAGGLAALGRAIDLKPDLGTAWYNRGLLHLNAQRLDEAERDLGRAAELAPGNADIARLLQQLRLARTRTPAGVRR
jgi:tetratricopeptide (TPR) repeat protein